MEPAAETVEQPKEEGKEEKEEKLEDSPTATVVEKAEKAGAELGIALETG